MTHYKSDDGSQGWTNINFITGRPGYKELKVYEQSGIKCWMCSYYENKKCNFYKGLEPYFTKSNKAACKNFKILGGKDGDKLSYY